MKKVLILLLFFLLTSCASIFSKRILKKTGVFDAKSKVKTIKNKEKSIVFIPMHHIGRIAYYDDVANKIDSLQKLNYIVFYEGVNDQDKDSIIRRKNLLKLRKIMGFYPQGQKGYLDTTTNIIAGKLKYKGAYKLINQPNYKQLNIDSLTAIRADVNLTELMADFEKKNGEIKLDSCDYKLSFKDKNYKCKKAKKRIRKKFRKEHVMNYRNKVLAKRIVKSKKNKIVVVYGSAHFTGLWYQLYLLDKSYTISKM
jgi:major membrane immunogen (membrane-anchored lipoprotein)